jgi:hypothetical protein
VKDKPVDRRWLINTIGPWWLVLAICTMGVFFLVEQLVYEYIDMARKRKAGDK